MRPVRFFLLPLWTAWALLGMAPDSRAETSIDDISSVSLIAARQGVAPGAEEISAGLRIRLAPGWKTYWRSPGDAGFPLDAQWTRLDNITDVTLLWPVPERYLDHGLETIGYASDVILPLVLTLDDSTKAVALEGRVSYLVCERVCVPRQDDVVLYLPSREAARTPFAPMIEQALARVPPPDPVGLAPRGAWWDADDDVLEIEVLGSEPFRHPDAFVENLDDFSAPRVTLDDSRRLARFAFPRREGEEGSPVGRTIRVTVVDADSGHSGWFDLTVRLGAASPWWRMILMALAGGLILNIMPCVLPVLSLKLMGIVGTDSPQRAMVRRHFLVSAAGIFLSFALLALFLMALEAAGHAVGWGIHFHSPVFLAAMSALVSLFAASILFSAPIIPGGRWMTRWAQSSAREGYGGAFAQGVFAVFLATPCSAPFLGTAAGFALARGGVDILMVFQAVAAGFAIPWLLIAAFPSFVSRLPRPGPWMRAVPFVLAAALLATALWLIGIIAAQSGEGVALGVGVGSLALLLSPRLPKLRTIAASVLLITVALLPLAADPPERTSTGDPFWQPFAADDVARSVRDGRIVLVDITAQWCLTCKVNHLLVLDRPEIRQALTEAGVIAIQGDWTLKNDDITTFLHGLGRYGVPFNVVFGPGAPQGIILPELLTQTRLLQAVTIAAQ